MLPGFRLLLTSVLLAASVLVFGLGAAALLRATHEEFVATPVLRNLQTPASPVVAEPPPPPTIALLRIEPAPPTVTENPANATSNEPEAATQPEIPAPPQDQNPVSAVQSASAPAESFADKPADQAQASRTTPPDLESSTALEAAKADSPPPAKPPETVTPAPTVLPSTSGLAPDVMARIDEKTPPELAPVKISPQPPKARRKAHRARHHRHAQLSRKRRLAMYRLLRHRTPPPPPPPPQPLFFQLFDPTAQDPVHQMQTTTVPPNPPLPQSGLAGRNRWTVR